MVEINKERMYEIIRKPIVTEKSTMLSSHNQVVFEVSVDAQKEEIKEAVEKLFKVDVESVRTLVKSGKLKVFRGKIGQRKKTKKAIVSLKDGQTIDLSIGV